MTMGTHHLMFSASMGAMEWGHLIPGVFFKLLLIQINHLIWDEKWNVTPLLGEF